MQKLTSLAQSLRDAEEAKQREATERAQTEGAARMRIAEAFDVHTAALPDTETPRPLPWFVHVQAYKHTPAMGRVCFKGISFETLAQMLRDYPPMPQTRWRSSARNESGIRCDGFVPEHADTRNPTDGVSIRLGGGVGYGQHAKAEWVCMLGAVCVEINAEIESQFSPRIAAKHNDWQGQTVSIDASTARIVYPLGDTSGLDSVRYQQGSKTAYPDFLIWGRAGSAGVAGYVQSIADETLRRSVESFAAYLKDKTEGLPPAKTEQGSRGMSAGSKAQDACLRSPAALADRALAEKHWKAYAQDNGIETTQAYFDHYAWALHWLAAHSLLEDPALIRKNGKPYKYGSAWINADGTIHGE